MKFSIPANDFSIFAQFLFPLWGRGQSLYHLIISGCMNQYGFFKGPIDDSSDDDNVATRAYLTLACEVQCDSKWAAWVGECG